MSCISNIKPMFLIWNGACDLTSLYDLFPLAIAMYIVSFRSFPLSNLLCTSSVLLYGARNLLQGDLRGRNIYPMK